MNKTRHWRGIGQSLRLDNILLDNSGMDNATLATQSQVDGAKAFVKSWQQLLERIAVKSAALLADAA